MLFSLRGDGEMMTWSQARKCWPWLITWKSGSPPGTRRSVIRNVSILPFSDQVIGNEYGPGTSMLDLIETLFSRHGIRSLRFDGKMDRSSRDATLASFKQIGGPKVILIRWGVYHVTLTEMYSYGNHHPAPSAVVLGKCHHSLKEDAPPTPSQFELGISKSRYQVRTYFHTCGVLLNFEHFSMDLSWNYAAESQAYDRLFKNVHCQWERMLSVVT